MKILITGATGFIGQRVLIKMLEEGHDVVVLVRNVDKVDNALKQKYLNSQLTILEIKNLEWKNEVKKFKPTTVIHLAAFLTSSDDSDAISALICANLDFGCHLLDSLKDTGLEYFINTGTFAEYRLNTNVPNPAYLYAATKTAFRSIISYYQSIQGFKIINVIPFTIYGGIDSQKKIIDFIYGSIHSNTPIKMSPGEQVLDFIHIDDVIIFYQKLISSLKNVNEDYLELSLGTSVGTTPRAIAMIIEEVTKEKTNIEWGGLPYRKRDTMYSVADLAATSNILNWKPAITVNRGIELYINNIKSER